MIVNPSQLRNVQDLIDRTWIIDTKNKYATGIDRRDWKLYRSIFTDELEIDFQSLFGQEPGTVSADEWVSNVCGAISGFNSTQHVFTNSVVDLRGDEAVLVTYMSARHYLIEEGVADMQCIGGYYTEKMVRQQGDWKIASCRLSVTWETGDRALFHKAALRLADRSQSSD